MDINTTAARECKQTFSESFDTLYYCCHVSPDQIQQVLQADSEGSSLRGISRINGLAYNTVVSIVRERQYTKSSTDSQ